MHAVHVEGDLGGQRHSSRSFRYDKIQRKIPAGLHDCDPSLYVRRFFRLLPHIKREVGSLTLSEPYHHCSKSLKTWYDSRGKCLCRSNFGEVAMELTKTGIYREIVLETRTRGDEMRCGPLVGAPTHD